MKTISSTKANINSPKTPGGISKSLLTPCRRVGLSRNWKKSGPSPFNSPLSGTPEVKQVEKVEKKTRKRKESCEEISQDVTNTPKSLISQELGSEVSTPTKNIDLPRRKKSKTLLSTINNTSEDQDGANEGDNSKNIIAGKDNTEKECIRMENKVIEPISTPVQLKSKTKSMKKKSPKVKKVSNFPNNEAKDKMITVSEDGQNEKTKVKSPDNLTKECIVVIQKKIFKHEICEKNNKLQKNNKEPQSDDKVQQKNNKELQNSNKELIAKKSSQTLFDSDMDDIPLGQLNKPNDTTVAYNTIEDEDDFTISKKNKKNECKPTIELPNPKKTNSKILKPEIKIQNTTQNSIDGDDEDFFEKKRTIVVKKTYLKPIKAKSTGSITQKDIDDLRTRIDRKKKMLLAKASTNDTKELRVLIKKWQKGCQEALIQLMDLMKNKMPSNEQMDYSNMLKVLKIPANLVGYDSENDMFCTPDDESIILASVGD